MFLQRLEVQGFKSFVERTELRFGPGITAIVGPNGCGKTNITDAIRWVLGEQSAKQLRGSTMEDVIFGGSLRRKPVGMAEVTLTLNNESGALPTEYTEVQIGRRVYRSGSSDYSLNGTPVRLRDIRDLFYGTGMGSHAYSVIERSMVDHVLSDASGHRRFLFEEASGITKYKQRKREALNKLAATEADLLRVQDIVAELDRELGSLSRQVAKTRRAQRLREGIRDLDLRLSYDQHRASFARDRELAERALEESARRERAGAELARVEASHLEEKTALIEKEKVLADSRQVLSECEGRRQRAENEIAVLGERAEGLERQIAELVAERERMDRRLQALDESEGALGESVERSGAAVEEAKAAAAREEAELERISEALKDRRLAVAEKKQVALGLLQTESERKTEWGRLQARLSALQERREAAAERLAEIDERLRELGGEERAASSERERLEQALAESRRAEEEARAGRAAAEEAVEAALGAETEHRETLTRHRTRIETLEDLRSAMEGLAEGVKHLLSEPETSGARGVVADHLEVEPTHLDAVEALVGPLLGAAVVADEATADAALTRVAEQNAGHAAMVVLERGRGRRSIRALDPREPGLVGWVREGMTAREGFDGLVEVLVDDAFLVETPEDAQRLSAAHPGFRFVSRSGVVWAGGVASGGRPSDADRGLLRREHELRGLREERERAERSFAEAQEARLAQIRERDDRGRALDEIEARSAELARALEAQITRLEGLSREVATARREREGRHGETAVLEREEGELAAAASAVQAALTEQGREASSASESLSAIEQEVERLEGEREAVAARAAAARRRGSEAQDEHAEAVSSRARLEAERAEIHEARRGREREREAAEARLDETRGTRGRREEELAAIREEEARLRAAADQAVAGNREARERLEAAEQAASEARLAQQQQAELVHQLEVERLTLRADLEKTLERLRVEYDVDLTRWEPEALPEGETWDPEEATERLLQLRQRYDNLGPVNLLALEEFDKKKERHEFLTSQRDDLLAAKQQLLEAIEKINDTASKLFVETFAEVERNFQETFQTLFDGGECALRAVGEDPLECEIEIEARPRGKRLQSILLLSGGERALTAIALLFAIYLVKPSPFCILDEVDAPLDDANVERFVRMLNRFSARTQFIVVTHNKKTMETAASLYGVTMQEPGISSLVSVRFEAPETPGTNGGGGAHRASSRSTTRGEAGGAETEEEAAEPEPSLAGALGDGDSG